MSQSYHDFIVNEEHIVISQVAVTCQLSTHVFFQTCFCSQSGSGFAILFDLRMG